MASARIAAGRVSVVTMWALGTLSACRGEEAASTSTPGAPASQAASIAPSASPSGDPSSKRDHLCDTPPTYDTLKVPLTRRIEERGVVLGVLRIAKDNSATFMAEPAAPAESVKRLQQVIDELVKGRTLNLDWGGRTRAGVEYSCGGEVKRSDPRYPALFLVRVRSRYDGTLNFVEVPDIGR